MTANPRKTRYFRYVRCTRCGMLVDGVFYPDQIASLCCPHCQTPTLRPVITKWTEGASS